MTNRTQPNAPQRNGFTAWRSARIVTAYLYLIATFGTVAEAEPANSRQNPADPELQRIEATMEGAVTQTDLNRGSRALAEYWERRLDEVEGRIPGQLVDAEAAELFRAAREAWRIYRKAEVLLGGDAVRGRTARPMVEYLAWADLTEARVRRLERLYTETDEPNE